MSDVYGYEYVHAWCVRARQAREAAAVSAAASAGPDSGGSAPEESFSDYLLRKIREAGMTDAQCWRKAQLNRAHFNKIKQNPDYHPGRNTVIALALALKLDRAEADRLLQKAGYALSDSSKADRIVAECIDRRIFDLDDVNVRLYEAGQPILGAR